MNIAPCQTTPYERYGRACDSELARERPVALMGPPDQDDLGLGELRLSSPAGVFSDGHERQVHHVHAGSVLALMVDDAIIRYRTMRALPDHAMSELFAEQAVAVLVRAPDPDVAAGGRIHRPARREVGGLQSGSMTTNERPGSVPDDGRICTAAAAAQSRRGSRVISPKVVTADESLGLTFDAVPATTCVGGERRWASAATLAQLRIRITHHAASLYEVVNGERECSGSRSPHSIQKDLAWDSR